MVTTAGFKDGFVLTNDSNYSGWWAKQANQMWKDATTKPFTHNCVQGSTSDDRHADWGVFRKHHLDGDGKDSAPSHQEQLDILHGYAQIYGLYIFLSS